MVFTWLLFLRFQMLSTLSRPPVIKSQPEGEKASDVTALMWFSRGTPLVIQEGEERDTGVC